MSRNTPYFWARTYMKTWFRIFLFPLLQLFYLFQSPCISVDINWNVTFHHWKVVNQGCWPKLVDPEQTRFWSNLGNENFSWNFLEQISLETSVCSNSLMCWQTDYWELWGHVDYGYRTLYMHILYVKFP